jgi:DNA-binding NtrC family response regulator
MSSKPKILVVDDEARFRTTLGKRLSRRGFEIVTLGSGKDALETLREQTFDVIVLDIRMPEMDGIETLAHIKKIDAGIEVIILTGHASVDSAVEITKLGGYDYLLKPCPIDDLVDKIERAYERKVNRERRIQMKKILI